LKDTLRKVLCWILVLAPAIVIAGPSEDANALFDLWSATYTSNDTDKLTELYAPDAILLGTVSPVISSGTEAIRKYFVPLKGSGNKNTIQERHTIVLSDSAVVVTGFYEFVSLVDGKMTPRPSRFTCSSPSATGNGGSGTITLRRA
jgi:uncharacterized protein (TIGR02246 family)